MVNTSSIDGLVTVRNATSYVAAKHAVSALSETAYRSVDPNFSRSTGREPS